MRAKLLVLVAAVFVLGGTKWIGTLSGQGVAQSNDEAAVREVLAKSASSFAKNDMAAASQVWANDESLIVFESGHANYGWADYRDNHLGPEMKEMQSTNYTFGDVKVHLAGNTAWATMKYSIAADVAEAGKTRHVEGAGLATAVLEKREGQWRIVHWHSSAPRRAPSPTPSPTPGAGPPSSPAAVSSPSTTATPTAAQQTTKPPDTVSLGEKAALGKISFHHLDHITKNYNIEGIHPVQCIECHHVEQPESEAKKFPPHQTAYPANRTTTLTLDLLEKEPGTKVTPCRSCHARKDEKPLLLPAIPEIKSENSTAIITVTNQQAFHRACAGCHDQVLKVRPDAKAPGTTKCTMCHKKVVA